jgi:hypothetical protein
MSASVFASLTKSKRPVFFLMSLRNGKKVQKGEMSRGRPGYKRFSVSETGSFRPGLFLNRDTTVDRPLGVH